jgi:hypothetical protein
MMCRSSLALCLYGVVHGLDVAISGMPANASMEASTSEMPLTTSVGSSFQEQCQAWVGGQGLKPSTCEGAPEVDGCYRGLPPVSAADGAWCVAGQMTTCENYCTVSGLCTASLCAATDTPVGASSASPGAYNGGVSGYDGLDYDCYLPKNCYADHGAVELDHEDINRGGSVSACAAACNGDSRCAGFVYMSSQRKCWRRSEFWLSGCDGGEWGQESSEFMTCLRQ